MSQILNPSAGGGGGGGIIQTINGDIGPGITGPVVTIFANNATLQAGSSVLFNNSGTVSTLIVTDSHGNTIFGKNSGKAGITGNDNNGFGQGNLAALTTGNDNIAIGNNVLEAITTSNGNIGIGAGNLVGLGASPGFNIAIGTNSLSGLVSGRNVLALGDIAGANYTSSESSNIVINHVGVTGESNVMRIGTQGTGNGQVNQTFIAGIVGVTTSNSEMVTIDSTTGQLGVAAIPGGATTSFSVALTAASANFASGSGPNTIVYDTVLVDTASGYAAGVYTVPVGGTGNWFLSAVFLAQTSVSFTVCDLFLNKNSGTFILHLTPSSTTDGVTSNNGSGSGIFPLVAGDTLQWQIFATTTGAATYNLTGASNGFFNIFSGYKLP